MSRSPGQVWSVYKEKTGLGRGWCEGMVVLDWEYGVGYHWRRFPETFAPQL